MMGDWVISLLVMCSEMMSIRRRDLHRAVEMSEDMD